MAGGGRGRGTRGGVLTRRMSGRGAPPGPTLLSAVGCTMPVETAVHGHLRVEVRSRDGRFGGAGGSGVDNVDAAISSIVRQGQVPFAVLIGEFALWSTFVTAAGASGGTKVARSGRRWAVMKEEKSRVANLRRSNTVVNTHILTVFV